MKSKMIQTIKQLTVKQQIILLFLITAIPIIVLNSYGNYKAEQVLKRDVTRAYSELNKQNMVLINRDIGAINKISSTIIQNPAVQDLLANPEDSVNDRVHKYEKAEKLLINYPQELGGGDPVYYSLYVYDPDNRYFFAPYYPESMKAGVYFFSKNQKPEWFDEVVQKKGNGYLRIMDKLSPHSKPETTLTYARAVNNIYRGNVKDSDHTIGVLVVTKMDTRMEAILQTVSLPEGDIYLTDWSNRILASNTPSIGQHLDIPQQAAERNMMSGVETKMNSQYIFMVNRNGLLGQKLVYKIPVKALLQQQQEIKHVIQFITVLYSVSVIVIILYFWRSLMSPLHKLAYFVRHYEPGKEVPKTSRAGRSDEISILITSTYDMARRLNGLIHYKYQMEIKQKESELQILYQQINPHLLYNTLESIYWKSTLEGNMESAEMIKELSKLMKISLSRGREVITLEEELEHAAAYIKLQKHRHDYQFEMTWNIPTELRMEQIPKITLQPLLENAIIHGIKNMGEDGIIRVSAVRQEQNFCIQVEDNGFKKVNFDRLVRLLDEDNPDHSSGYGVRNIHRRIRLHYGLEYGLSYQEGHSGGTIVCVTLPLGAVDVTPCEATLGGEK